MGSIFKFVIFVVVLESKIVELLSIMRNVFESYEMGNGRYWKFKNFFNIYDGKIYSSWMVLVKSINVIVVKVLEKIGLDRVTRFVRRIGFESEIQCNFFVALGSNMVFSFEFINAYVIFVSGGWYDKFMLVFCIEDMFGNVFFEVKSK